MLTDSEVELSNAFLVFTWKFELDAIIGLDSFFFRSGAEFGSTFFSKETREKR